ncbi:MAG: universal stress protein [Gemmatimonadales bacterium]|nr:MAG: universal stress protein [Gemmatimonadales bacterium]
MQEIFVPVDGSENSTRAARVAARLARGLGAELCLFHVLSAVSTELVGLASLPAEEIDRIRASAGRRAFDAVREAVADELPADLRERTAIGDPAEEIVRLSEAHPDSLLVMGRRGRSPMKNLVMGSVSDKVLRHAATPVTVVS